MSRRNEGIMLAALLAIAATRKKTSTWLGQAGLVALARSTGFPDPELASAVALAESGGNPDAVGKAGEIGLWQIHPPSHPQYSRAELADPNYNARAAFAISNHGTNWQPWTTYRDGSYRKFLPKGITR